MNSIQESKIITNDKLKSSLLNFFLIINLLALFVTFGLNFLGSPVLKYHYIIHILITIAAIVLFDFSQILPIILTLYFIEGQGRIIWEYASWSRIIFDALVFLSIIKIFIVKRKIINLQSVPAPYVLLISLHFLWYAVEFSNLYSVSYFAVMAATKLYIYPILFFLGLAQTNFDVYEKNFQKTLNFFILLLLMELALSFFQFSVKETHILKISPYYYKAMTDGVFAGKLYRPFGTTQLPGAISSFLFLTVGFLFLKAESKLGYFFRIILIAASGFTIILCQVRSAFVKFLLVIIIIYLGELIFYRFRAKSFIGLILIFIILLFGNQYVTSNQASTGDESVDYIRDRIGSLAEVNKIKGSRLTTDQFMKIVSLKLSENPLGLGPGLTGPSGSMSKDELVGNRFINAGMTWTSDNILIALVIDFGFGAIFYILVILYIPAYFIRFLVIYFQKKNYKSYKILLVCFSSILAIIIGNWGAIGITYNPESFAFWFFTAIGFSTIAKDKRNLEKQKLTLPS